jgi:hypothetical protein
VASRNPRVRETDSPHKTKTTNNERGPSRRRAPCWNPQIIKESHGPGLRPSTTPFLFPMEPSRSYPSGHRSRMTRVTGPVENRRRTAHPENPARPGITELAYGYGAAGCCQSRPRESRRGSLSLSLGSRDNRVSVSRATAKRWLGTPGMHGVCDSSTAGILFVVGMRGCSTFDITTWKCEGARISGEAALLAANCSGAEHHPSWTFPLAVGGQSALSWLQVQVLE